MLLKYLDISLPLTDRPISGRVQRFEWTATHYKHDFGMLRFLDWDIDDSAVISGTPISITATVESSQHTFYGYIYYTDPVRSSHQHYTDIYIIGESYVMRQASQSVYHHVTASDVVKKIAKKHNFAYDIAPHKRVYPQISQAGRSDWEMMVHLAEQSGYSLKSDGGIVYFKPLSEDFFKYKSSAPRFFTVPPTNAVPPRMYSFEPLSGESLDFDDIYKAATAVSGVDPKTGMQFAVVNPKAPKGLRAKDQHPEFFDRFEIGTVTQDRSAAKFEAEAIDERNRYPYRATAQLLGTPDLKPGMPIFVENMNNKYDGYWTVLEATHKMDGERFVTNVVLGTDTLEGQETAPAGGIAASAKRFPAKLSVSGQSVKPSKIMKMHKVVNRLSSTPSTSVSALWVNPAGDVRNKTANTAKVATLLGA